MNKVAILTGDLNNAGDFLIGEKTRQLFQHFLPKSELHFIKRNKPYTNEEINLMNSSDLVVIAGGPAVTSNCARALHLENCLDKITAPIIMFGVGQYTSTTKNTLEPIEFEESSKKLMNRLEQSQYFSSLRDFRTENILKQSGYKNFKFTGCPVMYDLSSLDKTPSKFNLNTIKRIVFSTGSPFHSKMKPFIQQISIIKKLKKEFKDIEFIVAFHHSANIDDFKKSYSKVRKGYLELLRFCESNNIKTVDISGSHKEMINLYSNCDLHIGYRVHAHVLMSSLRKHSILIIEDGRGLGMAEVINGTYFNAYNTKKILKESKFYDMNLANKLIDYIQKASKNNSYLNTVPVQYFDEMENFFKQFRKEG